MSRSPRAPKQYALTYSNSKGMFKGKAKGRGNACFSLALPSEVFEIRRPVHLHLFKMVAGQQTTAEKKDDDENQKIEDQDHAGRFLLIHRLEEFVVVLGVLHLVEQKLHCVDRAHRVQNTA